MPSVSDFGNVASRLARNPLGIIALFIVLVYGIAGYVTTSVAPSLSSSMLWVLIIFIVTFPFVILAAFVWLVVHHHSKLYAPEDFQDESNFMGIVEGLQPVGVVEKEMLEESKLEKLFKLLDSFPSKANLSTTQVAAETDGDRRNSTRSKSNVRQFQQDLQKYEELARMQLRQTSSDKFLFGSNGVVLEGEGSKVIFDDLAGNSSDPSGTVFTAIEYRYIPSEVPLTWREAVSELGDGLVAKIKTAEKILGAQKRKDVHQYMAVFVVGAEGWVLESFADALTEYVKSKAGVKFKATAVTAKRLEQLDFETSGSDSNE